MFPIVEQINTIVQQANHQGVKINVMIYGQVAKVVAYKDTSGLPLGRIYARERLIDIQAPDLGEAMLAAVSAVFTEIEDEQAVWLSANKEEQAVAEHIARNLAEEPAAPYVSEAEDQPRGEPNVT